MQMFAQAEKTQGPSTARLRRYAQDDGLVEWDSVARRMQVLCKYKSPS